MGSSKSSHSYVDHFRPLPGSGGDGGGGGGTGAGLPPGGTFKQVLTKRSSTNGDAIWQTPSELYFSYVTPFNIDGTETSGEAHQFMVPGSLLGPTAFSYLLQGSGWGTIFATNRNVVGTPSGGWDIMVEDDWNDGNGLSFHRVTGLSLISNPFPSPNMIIRTGAGATNIFHYVPSRGGIVFQAVYNTGGLSGPATLELGIQGFIVGF